MMRQPRFWAKGGNPLLRRLLAPLGFLYGWLTMRRMRKPGWRAPVPVISVGNFTVGGGGKTPTTLALVRHLIAAGETPVVVTRGYGGRLAGPVQVDPGRHTASETGDEPLLLARLTRTIVSRDRPAGADVACQSGATCLVLDDALQNPTLAKDLSLAVVDAGFGFGNGACLPAGPLRAPVAAMARHVDALLLIGRAHDGLTLPAGLPVFRADLVAEPLDVPGPAPRVLAYCGLARPEKFHQSLAEAGMVVAARRDFPDHHPYSPEEALALLETARREGLALVTTEKDIVRLSGHPDLERLAQASLVLRIRIEAEPAFWTWVDQRLASARSR